MTNSCILHHAGGTGSILADTALAQPKDAGELAW
jgi:hypothetical protein